MTQLPSGNDWAYIHHRRFESADLSEVNLRDAPLAHRRFRLCRLSSVSLTHVKLQGSTFFKCDLSGSTFENCNMRDGLFANCRMKRTAMTGCNLTNAKIIHIVIDDSDLSGGKNILRECVLRDVHFKNCNLARLDLTRSKLHKIRFVGSCDLTGLRLTAKQLQKKVTFVGVAAAMLRKMIVRGVKRVDETAVTLTIGAARQMSSLAEAVHWSISGLFVDSGRLTWNRMLDFLHGGHHIFFFVFSPRALLYLTIGALLISSMVASALLIVFALFGIELTAPSFVLTIAISMMLLTFPAARSYRVIAKRRRWLLRRRSGLETSTLQMDAWPR